MGNFCVSFVTYCLGCRTNRAELDVISDQLSAIGFAHSLSGNTQHPIPQSSLTRSNISLVLINTCMVTNKAERETRKAIRHFRQLYPNAKIVVMGCAVTAKEKFKINLPEADLLISNEEKNKATEIILEYCSSEIENHGQRTSRLTPFARRIKSAKSDMEYCYSKISCHYFSSRLNTNPKSDYEESGRKFIKIQDGCDNNCSFCITTYLRGEPRSEEPRKIVGLIDEWVNRGIKETILTGINIGLYGIDLKPQTNIWSLADRILKETKIERLTLSTVYPEMLSGKRLFTDYCLLITNPRLTHCFHLALQSGSPTVLQRMNRPTDLKKLLKAINQISKIQPDFTFRADVIAGFPDETEEEHQQTLDFIKKAQICFAHVFSYSPRIGTVAYKMIQKKKWQDLPMEVKKERAEEIRKLVSQINREVERKSIGKIYQTLIVREIKGRLEGTTGNGMTVLISNKQKAINNERGVIQPVRITGHEESHLTGTILSLPI